MPKVKITKRQKEMLSIIYNYIKDTGYPPTFEEMRERLEVTSNQSVVDLLNKLEEKKFIQRSENIARSIVILPLGYEFIEGEPLVPFLGISHAGAPINTIELDGEWQQLTGNVSKLDQDVFLLKISGDSMMGAGIEDGDVVLVQSKKEFISGEIVLAEIEGESTIKRFISEDKPPYLYLKPENPEYQITHFTEKVELKGKVISVIKDGQLKQVN